MDAKLKIHVETLLVRAAKAVDAPQALNFSQAACNAANALRVLLEMERFEKSPKD